MIKNKAPLVTILFSNDAKKTKRDFLNLSVDDIKNYTSEEWYYARGDPASKFISDDSGNLNLIFYNMYYIIFTYNM